MNADESAPPWAQRRFGDDAERIRAALREALLDTQDAMLDSHVAGRSKKRFAAGSARMTNQYERVAEHVSALGIEGTERIKPGTFYELILVHNTLLYPVHVDGVEGAAPGRKWPKKVSGVVRELFAAAEKPSQRWVADPFSGLEDSQPVLRRSLAELAGRDPQPALVLIPYEMNLAGLHRAWWGQATMLDAGGTLDWVTECSLLATGEALGLSVVPTPRTDDGFDSGRIPEVPLSTRGEADRVLNLPPQTEAEEQRAKHAESDEN